jgi:hypothetical protein
MRGNCFSGWYWWVRAEVVEATPVPPHTACSPERIQAVKNISRDLDVAASGFQRVVQGILDELRELLGERLHIIVRDHAWARHTGTSRARKSFRSQNRRRAFPEQHTVASPKRVVSGVARHGDDQLALLFWKLLEESPFAETRYRRRRTPRRSSST